MKTAIRTQIVESIRAAIKGFESGLSALFHWPGVKTLAATTGTAPTFTRATSATFEDFEGLIKTVDSSEPRFQGARRVAQLFAESENLTNAVAWDIQTNVTIVDVSDTISPPAGVTAKVFKITNTAAGLWRTAENFGVLTLPKGSYTHSWWVMRATGTDQSFRLLANNATAPDSGQSITGALTATDDWQRFSHSYTETTDFPSGIAGINSDASSTPASIYVCAPMFEIVTGQANKNPSEYVSTGVATGSDIELIPNQFGVGWTIGTGATVVGETLVVASGSSPNLAYYASSALFGIPQTLKVTYTISNYVSGVVVCNAGQTSISAARSANGTFTETLVVNGSYIYVNFFNSSNFTGSISNVSVKRVSHGANVDGVQYFDTLNANTVSGNVVTEATGSALTAATTQFGELAGAAGDYFSTPNSAALDITNEVDIRWFGILNDWSPSAVEVFIGKYISNGFSFSLNAAGTLRATLDSYGVNSTAPQNFTNGGRGGVRVTILLDDGAGSTIIKFYTSDDGSTWNQLGTTITVGSIKPLTNNAAELALGAANGGASLNVDGRIYRAQVFNEIDGTTPIADFTPGSHVSGPTLVSSTTNAVWTLNGNATIFHPPVDSDGPFGYLSEKASTNLVLQSEDFTTSWTVSGASITANAAVAPDGTTTMDRLVVQAVAGNHNAYQLVTITGGTNYTASVYIKDDGAGFGGVCFGASSNHITVVANLSTGVVTATEVGSGSGTIVATGCDSVGNGIYRVWISGNKAGTAGYIIPFASDVAVPTSWAGGRPNYTGVLGEDILIWGAQLELGTYPTSYIPTTTTAVARNGDVLTAGDMVTDAAGTAYAEGSSNWASVPSNAFLLRRGASGIPLYRAGSSDRVFVFDGTSTPSSPAGLSYQNRPAPFASTWGDNLTAYQDGVAGTAGSYDGTMGTGNLTIGVYTSTGQWDGTVRDVKVFNSELTAEQVADLSPDPVPPAPAQFDWLGQTTLVPTIGDTPTFTRATSASFEDFEGLVKTVDSSEPRFVGARRVENLVTYSEGLLTDGNFQAVSGITDVLESGVVLPDGQTGTVNRIGGMDAGDAAVRLAFSSAENGLTYTYSFWIRSVTGTVSGLRFKVDGPLDTFPVVTETWQKFSMSGTGSASTEYILRTDVSGTSSDVYITQVQVEEVTGQSNQNPSEYVSTGVGLGPELVTNGDFATDSDWTKGTGWSISGGYATCDGTNASQITQGSDIVAGKVYEVSYEIIARTSGSIRLVLGTYTGLVDSTVGSHTVIFVAAASGALGFRSSNFDGSINSVSVKSASHGANVDGVKYFDTLNANTVSSNVVTEATGSALTPATTQFGELHGVGDDYFSTPDIVTTWDELDIRVRASVDSITGSWAFLADKKNSFFLGVRPSGSTQMLVLRNYLSVGSQVDTSSVAFPTSLLSVRTWFRATLDAATGDKKFYTADGSLENPALTDYVQLGTTTTIGATSIRVNTEPFTSGTYQKGNHLYPFDGEIYRSQIFNTVDGTTPVVDFTPGSYVSGSTLVSSNTGETWTLQGNATVFQPPVDASGPFGYLSEKASTNLVLQSENFTTSWTPQGGSITANAATAPDGATTMDRLVVTATGSYHDVYQFSSISPSVNYTASVYMKDDGAGFGGICFKGVGPHHISVVVNLSTGVVTDTDVGATSGTIVASGCDSVGNGIYRVWISGSIGDANGYRIPFASDVAVPTAWFDGRPSYTAVLGEDILIWGAQLEVSTYPTSYIPTTTTAVTRNADNLIAGDMVTDAAGTAYAEGSSIWATSAGSVYLLFRTGGHLLYRNAGDANRIITYDGVNVSALTSAPSYYNRVAPFASTWGDNLTVYKDGSPDLTPAAYDGTMGTGNLAIGSLNTGTNHWDGTIRHVKILSTELTAAEVADL